METTKFRIKPIVKGDKKRWVIEKKVFFFFWQTLCDQLASPALPKEYKFLPDAEKALTKILTNK